MMFGTSAIVDQNGVTIYDSASTTSNPQDWFVEWVRGGPSSDSGVTVNAKTSMMFAPLWHGISKISAHVGIVPLVLMMQSNRRETQEAIEHPANYLFRVEPNRLMGPCVFKETITAHALLEGDGRAEIIRNGRGEPMRLDVIEPRLLDAPEIIDGEKYHILRSEDGQPERAIRDINMLHIVGLSPDGVAGYCLREMAKNSLGLGLAAEKHSSKHFANSAVPPLLIKAPRGRFRTEEEAREYLRRFNAWHQGVENTGKTGLLQDAEVQELGQTGRDAQWIEQRKFQRQEAALWLLLEEIIGDDSSVSYNSLEQKMLAYVRNGLERWLTKWEEECNRKLLTESQKRRRTHFFKFRTGKFLRSTTKERYEVYQIGRQIGVLSANDVRLLEDMNPIEGGDEYTNPAITPGASADQEDDSGDQTSTVDDRLTRMISSRISEVMEVEKRRVWDAANKSQDNHAFAKWVDEFYESFVTRLIKVYEACDGTQAMAYQHAAYSKERLMSHAMHEGAALRFAVLNEIESWFGDRLNAITEELRQNE